MTGAVTVREATEADLPRVVELIHLGAFSDSPEDPGPPLPQAYIETFRAIAATDHTRVLVAERDGVVLGTVQMAVILNLSHQGRPVAQLESLHVAETARSQGVGETLVRYCMQRARQQGCFRIQLTSNKGRKDAHRFYFRLGFKASHEGMKLDLD